ncbi:hypothetical protein JHK87_006667 [Glycine soja]|nr:hypothetical protein JHK87_006667 [Glycine soja]
MGYLRNALHAYLNKAGDRRSKVHNSNTAVNSPVVEVTTDYDGHGDTTVVEITTDYDGCFPRTVVEGSYHYNDVLLRTTVVRDGVNTTTVLFNQRLQKNIPISRGHVIIRLKPPGTKALMQEQGYDGDQQKKGEIKEKWKELFLDVPSTM